MTTALTDVPRHYVGDRLDPETQRMFDKLRETWPSETLARRLRCGDPMLVRLDNNGTATKAAIARLTPTIREVYMGDKS